MSEFPFHQEQFPHSRAVPVGNLQIGGTHPVVVQSMTTTRTNNTDATVEQIMKLADAGCAMVRLAVQNKREARNLENIKNKLVGKGYTLPLVADVHFNPEVAEAAAEYVEKVRINPGNFIKEIRTKRVYSDEEYSLELKRTEEKLVSLLEICRQHNTAIRIGVNHGSLANRILVRHGNTPEGMVESAMEFINICRQYGFDRLTLSLKASDVRIMIAANKLLVSRMISEGTYYPLHLGVTEAGAGIDGRLKSAAGIGHLLMLGIGDTVRVSLTEDPVEEIPVAQKLVDLYGKKEPPRIDAERIVLKNTKEKRKGQTFKPPYNVSVKKSSVSDFSLNESDDRVPLQTKYRDALPFILKLNYTGNLETFRLRAAAEFSLLQDIYPVQGICLYHPGVSANNIARLSLDILQAIGLRYSRAEFIACPSCGRTRFDIQKHLKRVKAGTSHLKGLKIAVMGCDVNGPGEMAGADYGYVGSSQRKISLYKGASLVRKNIDEASALESLIDLIRKNGDWREKN